MIDGSEQRFFSDSFLSVDATRLSPVITLSRTLSIRPAAVEKVKKKKIITRNTRTIIRLRKDDFPATTAAVSADYNMLSWDRPEYKNASIGPGRTTV